MTLPSDDWIKLGEDGSHARPVAEATLVGVKCFSQFVATYQSQVERVPRFCLVSNQDLDDPVVIGGDKNVICVAVREVAAQACKKHLDHITHGAVVSIVCTVKRYMYDWAGFSMHTHNRIAAHRFCLKSLSSRSVQL